MSGRPDIEIREVTDLASFELLPACADPRFDHRSCDYWEDEIRGAKTARPGWWQVRPASKPAPPPVERSDNPFAPPPRDDDALNPFASPSATGDFNPFAPEPKVDPAAVRQGSPSKLRLLLRGRGVFGSYAKVLLWQGVPGVFAQFGPLSAYPRARHIRELYPRLPATPLPAVITCIATSPAARGHGLARLLVHAVVQDLAERGFSAIEAYPDLTLSADESSAASPAFWISCGFDIAIDDEHYPVLRLELD